MSILSFVLDDIDKIAGLSGIESMSISTGRATRIREDPFVILCPVDLMSIDSSAL